MQTNFRLTIATIAALQVVSCIGAAVANADSRQDNKNLWRNATIASGAVALYGLAKHNTTLTIAGAAGAAYSANRYEQDRHSQSVASNSSPRAYYRGGGDRHWHHDYSRHDDWYRHHGRHHHHYDHD